MSLTIEKLRRAAQGSSESTIDHALGSASADEIAQMLPQTVPADRFLRIVLRNRLAKKWPLTSDEYQDACIFLAAERVGAGGRAFASELGIPGNEYATLNDAVLERHIEATDADHRIAAAQMMRPGHLHLIERRLAVEDDERARAGLREAGQRIAGERGAPPSALLSGPDRLAQLVRLFGRDKGWLRWSTAAACFGQDAEELRAAASELPMIHSSGAFFFVAEGGRTPPPLVPDLGDARELALRMACSDALGRVKAFAPTHARQLAEFWLRAQTGLWLPDLRYWLGLPDLASAFEGVLLRAGTTPLRCHGGQIEGGVDLNAVLVMHHPIHGDSPWQDEAPKWQTNRPHLGQDELPDFEAAPEVAFADWTRRTKALGYEGVREQRAVIHTVRTVGNVRIHHSGHGEGYGKGPQRIREVSFPTHSDAAVSEVVWDVRRLLGIDPLKG
ncbi:hypothetical protein [Nannocystis radixulma]|uniref:Uncharacterized protein n=1 Tax=Nannocystis radixulma TaxID=2995305 RepID=A0ABT5BQW8_9BACT|nr:hypothetical protein [Nannocystis radixulma]MDC0675321.1 hypothetical protein [Nannocystis radixulma]